MRAARVLGELSKATSLMATLAMSRDEDAKAIADHVPAEKLLLPPLRARGPKPLFDPTPLAEIISARDYDVVVVDMLDTDADALKPLAQAGAVVITLDDRGPGRRDAHGIINFLVREPCPEELPAGVRLFEGPEYATLDETYRSPPAPKRPFVSGDARILVTLGGADAAGLAVKVARALTGVHGVGHVQFICGAAFRHREELEAVIGKAPWPSTISEPLPTLKSAFEACDIAVIAGGMTLHEACCTGTPAVAVCQPIDHQIELAEWFSQRGAMLTVGDGTTAPEATIAGAVRMLLEDAELRKQMMSVGPSLVDGYGTTRCARAILDIVNALLEERTRL